MKKNFFKKLSFVMALAMMVSMVAPAAGALAATDAHLNSTKKYLHLSGISGDSEFDFNISHKPTGCTYAWASTDETVATVDAKGVTVAKGVGKTTVSVTITDADGEEVAVLEAAVVVRDNIETVAIKNPTTKNLAVGESYNFDRTFVTESGSTTATESVTKWAVDKTTATISSNGTFVATAAGVYKVTALSFQSTAKYTEWKSDNTKYANNLLASAETTVTVAVGITKAELVTPSKIKLTLDSSVKDVVKAAADIKVEQKLANTTYTAMVPVWTLDSVSEDGKVVTFSTYDALVDKQTYVVTAAGASTEVYAQIGTPVAISMADQTLPAGTATKVAYSLVDAYGVDVSASYNTSVSKTSTVPFTDGTAGTLNLGDGVVAFVEYSFVIQKSDGTSTTITTGVHTVKGVAATVTGTFEWNVLTGEDFSKTTQTVKVGDNSQNIYGRVKKSDGSYTSSALYTFESLTPSVLLIDTSDDSLIPVAAGTALVKVTNAGTLVSYINVVVTAAPAVQSIKPSTASVTLSNDISVNGVTTQESATVTIKAVDQYGTETNATIQESYVVNTGKKTDLVLDPIVVGTSTVTFTAAAGKSGTFTYYVKANDKTCLITVTVATPGVLNSYVINASADSVDAYVANANTGSDTTFTVYGIDAAGVKKQQVRDMSTTVVNGVSGVAVSYTITHADGTAVASTTFSGSALYAVTDLDGEKEYAGTNTFTVNIGGIKYAKAFTVTNSRPTPVATIAALSTTAGNNTLVLDAVKAMITLKIGDNAATITGANFLSTNSAIVANDGATFSSTDGTVTLYITKVTTTSGGVTQTVDINKSFTVKVQ